MVFSSHIFVFYFLGITLALYFVSPRWLKSLILTLVSYVFYGWIQPWYVFLILFSTVVDYICGKVITADGASEFKRKFGVGVSVVSNLALLVFFKYTSFFISNFNSAQSFFGMEPSILPSYFYSIILPIGISFYSFQSMSYSIDLYRGDAKPARSFLDFACYVSMFPQLVAGPIVRYQTVAEQLVSRVHSLQGFVRGFTRFNFGFAKKILLANPVGGIADLCFSGAENGSLNFVCAWVGVFAYALQIYFDFSAYSDMAIGLGRMLGFRFLENFDSPYKSASITEFWRRWHISLSTFLRDYLYIPLGGNKSVNYRTYVNLMTVMFLGGLWHGASWNFVVWGCIHGVVLVLERFNGKQSYYHRISHFLKVLITFIIVNFSWVFFRAENFSVAWSYIKSMFGVNLVTDAYVVVQAQVFRPYAILLFLIALGSAFFMPNTQTLLAKMTLAKAVIGLLVFLLGLAMMFTQGFNPFLYFQF